MQIWITFILINTIHQTHVSAAPLDSVSAAPLDANFGKIAAGIINPAWLLNNPDLPKKDNKDTDLQKKNDENLPNTPDSDIDSPNTKNNKKNNSRQKNKTSGKKRNNNKRRRRNKRRRNSTRRNGRYLWYSVITMNDFLLNNYQLIRQKRDFNNILELQDYKLQTRNVHQHNLEENENSMNSNSNENIIENRKYLNLRNSNPNKFKNILQNRKQPTNTIINKISRTNHAQGLGITLGADNSEKEESQLKIIEENPQKINGITSSNDKPELSIGENTDIDINIPEIDKIDTLINRMNSNSDEGADDDQDSKSYPSSKETKNKIPNYSDIENNKQHHIIKNIKHQFKPKSRKLEKKQPKNNDKGTSQTRLTTNAPSKNHQKTPSIDIPQYITDGNTDIAKNIPVNDEIDTLISTMNSNSEENSSSENSDSNTSSSEKQQDILDFSDLGDNKEKNLLKSIKQPLKPISKMQGKKLLENNEKLPEINEKYLNNPSEINTKNEKGSRQKGNTPISININNQQTPPINVPGHITPELTDVTKNIPVNDEIEIFTNAINSNSGESKDGQNSESYPSSLETKQEIPNYSDVEDKKQHDLIKSIKHPFKPKSRKLEKKPPKNIDKGTSQTRLTPNDPSKNHQKTPSIDIPQYITDGNTEIAKNIPVNDEIDTLISTMNSNSEENSSSDNSDSNTSSSEKQQDILDFSDLKDNKEKNLLKSIKQPLKPISKLQGKKLLENNEKLPEINEKYLNNPSEINTNNEKGSRQKGNTPISININNQQTPPINVPGHITPELTDDTKNIPVNDEIETFTNAINSNDPSKNHQKTPSIDIPQYITDGNTVIAKNIPVNDEIDTLISTMNSNSEENSSSDNSDSNTSSSEKQQDILDFSDLKDNKEKNLLKSIKQPLKPISKLQGKKLLENNEKLPEINEKYLNNPSEINTNNEKGSRQKGNTPISININNQQTPPINVPGHITPELTDDTKNIPVNDEIETFTNAINSNDPSKNHQKIPSIDIPQYITDGNTEIAKNIPVNDEIDTLISTMNSNSEENSSSDNSDSNTSSSEKQQDILDFSDLKDNKEKNLLKSIKQPLKPISKLQGKKLLENNEKLPEINEKYLNNPSEINTNNEKGSRQKGNTPISININNQQTPPINVPGHITPELTDDTKNIPVNDEIETFTNAINSNDPSKNHQKTPSIDIPQYITDGNTEIAKNIPVNDEIDTLISTMNSNSEENSSSDNSDSNTSSSEKQQDILDFSDLKDNKEKNLLKSIKQPLKPISKLQGKKLLENNEKMPEINEKYLNNPSEINTNNEKGSRQKGNTPISININNQQTPPINVPGHITPELTDVTKNIPVNDEIETFTNAINSNDPSKNHQKTPSIDIPQYITDGNTDIAKNIPVNDEIDTLISTMNSNSEENSSSENSDSNTSSSEKQQDILDFSDLGDNKEKNLLKSIKQPLKPISKLQGKKLLENNEKLPEINEKYLNNPSEINTNNEKGSRQKTLTPIAQNLDQDRIKSTPAYDNFNIIKKKNSIKTPDLMDTIVPKTTDKIKKLSIETPFKDIDLTDSLEGLNNLGGITMEDAYVEKKEDKSHSSALDYNNKKDHDDILKKIKEPILKNPNTGKSNTEYAGNGSKIKSYTPKPSKNIKNIPKRLSKSWREKKLDKNSDSNSIDDLLSSSVSFDEVDLSRPGLKKKKVNPNSKTGNILQNTEDTTLKSTPCDHELKPNIKLKNKSIKASDLLDTIDPETTDEVEEFSIEIPLEDFAVSDSLEDLNNIGGMTMKGATKIKDKSPFSVLNNKKKKNHKDSIQKTNQNPNGNIHKSSSQTKNVEIPKPLSRSQGKRNLDDTSNSNSKNDLLNSSLDIDEADLSQPKLKKKKVNPKSKEGNILQNSDDTILKSIPRDDMNPDLLTMLIKPNNGNTNTEYKKKIETNIEESPSNLGILLLGFDGGALPQPGFKSKDDIIKSKTGDILPKSEDGKLKSSPGEDIKLNTIKKKKSIKTPDLIDTTVLMKPNTVNSNTEYNLRVDKCIEEIPKNLSNGEEKKKLFDKLSSNSNGDLFGGSLGFDEEDLSQPGMIKKKVVPMSKINDIITNVEDDKLRQIPTNNDDKSIKTTDVFDTTVPKSTKKISEFSTETPLNDIDISDPLEKHINLGGFTMEDAALEKMKDDSPSTTSNNNRKKDHDDSLQVTNQPVLMKPNTVNSNPEYNLRVDKSIEEIPKNLSNGEEKKKLLDKFSSNSYGDLFGGSLGFDEEDLSQPGTIKKKVVPISKTNDILTNVEDDNMIQIPTNNDDKSIIQKNKSIKTPDVFETTLPKSTEKISEFPTETPLNYIDVSDPLGEFNNLGGFTMEDTALQKIKDESPSTTSNNNRKKYHDDSLQVPHQPMLMKPNTEDKERVDKSIGEIPKNLSDGEEKKKLLDKFSSNSYGDLFGGSLGFDEEDLSQPGMIKKKVVSMSKTNDIITNVEDDKLIQIPTNNDDKSIKTPDVFDTTVPKSTEKISEFPTETPLNYIDVSDPLGEYNNLGGFTMEDAALENIKDESPSMTSNNNRKNDHDDSLQVTHQPMLMKPNTEYKERVDKSIEEIPKNLSNGEENKKLLDKFSSNSYGDLFGGSLGFDEEDLSQPGMIKKEVVPMSKTNDIITNVEDDNMIQIPTNNDDKSIIQKNKPLKTPDVFETTNPKSTEKISEFPTETPLNYIDVSDPLGEYNNLGGFTMEDAALENIKDESPSTTSNNNRKKYHDDSLQVPHQPMLMKPNTEDKERVDKSIGEIPKNLSDGEEKKKLLDKFSSNSYGDLFGGSLGFDEEDLSQPGMIKKKVVSMSKTNDIITNVEDDKLIQIPTNNDDKSIKTPDVFDTTVPKSTEKISEFPTETPLNYIDVSDPLGEYNNLGGFTMEDAALENIKDESPSMTSNNNRKNDHDDSLQVTHQPMLMKPNTEYKERVDKSIEEIPKNLSNGEENKKLLDKFSSNSYGDLFGGSLGFDEEDLSQPGMIKKKVVPMSKTNDIITNVEDDNMIQIPTNNDDKSIIQKNKLIKTPDVFETTLPKSTEKISEFPTETPLNYIDVSNPLGEYNNLGEFTMEDAALEKIKDESPSTTSNNNRKNDHDDSLQVTHQPMLMKPNTEYKERVDKSIEEIPKNLSDGEEKKKLLDKFSSNSYGDLFGGSLGFDEEDLSQPGTIKKKVVPISKTNDILTNVEDDNMIQIPTNNDDKSIIQKNKSIKTPDVFETTLPKSTEKISEFPTETPLNYIDVSDPLGEYSNIGGFTMEDAALEKIKDESPSTTSNNNRKKDHDDSLQVPHQPMLMKPNTEYKERVDKSIEEIPNNLSDGEEKKKLLDKFSLNSYGDLFGGSLGFGEEDLSQPGMIKKKVVPMSKTNDIITNVEDDKLIQIPTNNDDKSIIQKNKPIKTPDVFETTLPKSTEKISEFPTETPLNYIDVSNPLGEYNNLGGFTMEDAALQKIKDESPSTTSNNNRKKDHDDSLQVTHQPMLMKPNTEYKERVDKSIEEIPKNLSDGEEKKKLLDKFSSNSYGDFFGGSLGVDEEDLSQPGMIKKKVVPMSKTNDIITNVEDDKLIQIPTNNDDKSNIQKNKSIKTPDVFETTLPKSTEKISEFPTETPLNYIDVSDPLGEYSNIGGFTMEDAALEKIKDESPSTTSNNNRKKDHDDGLQVPHQPMLMKPNTEYKERVDKSIEEIPNNLSDGEEKKKLLDKFSLNSYGDLFGGPLGFDEEDLSQPGMIKKKVVPMSKTNDIITNVEDDKLIQIPTNNDDKSIIQKNKPIKTPDVFETTLPKSTEKISEFPTETPLNYIDVSNPLGEYNNLGGFTMEDAALQKIKDESPSTTSNNNRKKDHDDSLQVTHQPMLMKPNTEYKERVDKSIEEIPKNLSDGEEKKKLLDKFSSNSYGDFFGGLLGVDEEDLSQPGMIKKKVVPMSKTNDIITNVEDDKLIQIPRNNDDKSIIQKNKPIKTPDVFETTLPKSTEKISEFPTETPLNYIDVSDPLGEYSNIGGFTMEDGALEKIKDESPSTTSNNNRKKDHDDSLQVPHQPMLMKPNTEYKERVDKSIEEIPNNLSDGEEKKKLLDKFSLNSYGDLFGGSLGFDEEDLSQPGMIKKKVVPMSKTNDIITNVEDDKLIQIPTNNDDKSIIQKNKSIKTPDVFETTLPKSTEKISEFPTETPLNYIDVSNPLGEYNNLGGFTMEDDALEKKKDESPSTTSNNNRKNYHYDSLQVTHQPMLMKPKTEYKERVDKSIEEIPKNLSDGEEKKKLLDKFSSNSYGDLFGGSLGFDEEDLSQPGTIKKKVVPISKTNDILTNVEDDNMIQIPTNNDDKSIIQKNKPIKTPDVFETTDPKSTEKISEFSTETLLNDIDISDPLGEYSNIGGFTMEDAALEKIKDESPSTMSNNNRKKDHDDRLQVPHQPMLMKPNTEYKERVDKSIEEIPNNLSDGEEKIKLLDKFSSNSYGNLFGGSLGFVEEDLSQPGMIKKKVVPMSKTNDIITNVEDDKLIQIHTNNDDKSIKTPDVFDTTVPKSTEKISEFPTETPLNYIDVSDPLGEYSNIGGFTMEDAALEKIKDESPSTTSNNNRKKDHDDSLQVPHQPMLMKPNTEYKERVDKSIEEIPNNLSDGEEKKKLLDKFSLNSYGDLFGGSLGFDEEDLSQPGMIKKKVVPMSKTNDIITNVEDDKLIQIPTNNDDKSIIQKNKSIKTPDVFETTLPKSTEKISEFPTETPLNYIDVSNPLGEYNNLGGFTMEDDALEKKKDESPSTTSNNNRKNYHYDSLQVTHQPMLMKPKTEYKERVDKSIEEIPKNLSDGEEKKKLLDKFSSNSYGDLFGGSLGFDEEDLSQPGTIKKKVVPISKTNDILTNVEDDNMIQIPTNNDDKSIIQKNKPIKTPDVFETTDPKSTEKISEFSTETLLNDIDISDPLGEYSNIGGFTMEDAALEKIKDESPSTMSNNNRKKDHDDRLQVPHQPMLMKPNTEYKERVDKSIEEIPNNLSDGEEKIKLLDKFSSNSYGNLFGGSLGFDEEDLSQPGMIKKKVVPMSKTNDIITNVEDDKLIQIHTNNDDKSIKTPDVFDTTVPKSTEKISEFPTETPLNYIDVSDPLGEYNNLGGFTMEDAALQKIKDESPSTTSNNNRKKDHDDSLQVTLQPILMKPNTEYIVRVDKSIEEIPKKLSNGEEKKKLLDKFSSNSYGDLFGGSLGFDEEDLSQPGTIKKKVVPISKTNDIITNIEDDKLIQIPTNNDDKSIIQKNKSIKTPDVFETTLPKSTEKISEFPTETPLNYIDVSNPLGEYNNLGGFTMEDAALEKIKDESPSMTSNNNRKNDHDDSLQVTHQPMLMKPNTEYKVRVDKSIEEIPKKLSNGEEKKKLLDKFSSNSYGDLFGGTLGFDEEDLSQPRYEDKDVITKSQSGNILPNSDDVTLKSPLSDDDIKPNSLQKKKLIKKMNPVLNTDSKMFDLIEPTTLTNYDIIKNKNKLPLSKISSNVIDKYSSNSNTMHNDNNNLLNNDKDVTFNRSFITNPFVEYNSKDLSSLEDGDRYGFMLPKFSTKYSEGGESNYNIWETIPPKKNADVSLDKGYDNLINDFNQSSGYTTKNNKISTHNRNENNIVTRTESVKNNYNKDEVNTDIHNKQYDDFIKKMSEQLFKKIDNIYDKLSKLDKVSHNCSYVREIVNIGSHEPTMNNVLLTNDIPITKPEKVTNLEDSYSIKNKPIESFEINTSNKSDDEIEINKNESPKAKKHKNKKHKRHGRQNKKKGEKNNLTNDDDDDDGNHKNNKRHKHKDNHNDDDGKHKKNKRHKHKDNHNDDDGKHKKNKRHKNKDINKDDNKHEKNKRHKNKDLNNDDDGKHKKNKRHKNKDINNDDSGKHKKNKHHKKNKKINEDDDNGGHRKKSHKKKYSKVDDDVVSKHKKHKSHKKKYRNDNDVEILRSKTDNKKKKKIKENVYSPEESNDVNYSSSIQINSENNDSVKILKTTSSKSKISKKTNSTKSKKSSPKKKSKYVKHSKTIKYKNKEIPVDVSDEDTSSNENNYNSEKTYIKYISNNNQNNVPKDKNHKHKKHNKHLKTSKTYMYKKIPEDNEDKDSNENNVDLEETYNINIISDDDALRQKKHRHKKQKNFDIHIVKDTDTDTDTQVLNNDKKTQNGFQFYTFYPKYRCATLNPFARLLTNSYL